MAGFPSGGLASTNLPFFPIENIPGYSTNDIGPSVAAAIVQAQGFGEVIFPAASREKPLNWLTPVTAPAGPNLRFRGMGQDVTNILCGTLGQTNAGGIGVATGAPLSTLCPGALWDMTIDCGALAAIGTLSTALTKGTANAITTLTLNNPMVASQTAVITGRTLNSGNANVASNSNSPGVLNGNIVTSNVAGTLSPGTVVQSGAGSNTLVLNPAPIGNSSNATLTFTTVGTGVASLAGGVVTVIDPTGLHQQDFVLTGPVSGASVTTLNIFWDIPNFSFPIGSIVYAPVCQGAGMAFLYANPSTNSWGTGDGTMPNQYHLRGLVFKNLNATQYTPSTQQYSAMLIDVGSSYAPERYLIEGVQIGPNTNANQDSFTTNAERQTLIRNLTCRQIYRSCNFFTAKDLDVSGVTIENAIPGANTSGQSGETGGGRLLVVGESNMDAHASLRGVKMFDRYGVGGNIVIGTRSLDVVGMRLPGCENIITSVIPNVQANGTAGGTFTQINLAQAPLVPLSVMATANTPVKISELINTATGDWAGCCEAPNLYVVQAISTTQFTINFNSSSGPFTAPTVNNHGGTPGPGNLSWARFMMGTSDLQLNFSNDRTGSDMILVKGEFGSGVTITNGASGNGPVMVDVVGKTGAYYNGSGPGGCVQLQSTGHFGLLSLRGLLYANGGYIVGTSASLPTLDLIALASSQGNIPALGVTNMANTTIITPESVNIENVLPLYGTAVLAGGTIAVSVPSVTATSVIVLATKHATAGAVYVSAKTPGTGFTITSTNAADTGTVVWGIIEP